MSASASVARRGLSFPNARAPRTSPKSGREILLAQMSEADWQNQVITWARRAGWLVHHEHDSRFLEWGTDRGIPDLILVRAPRVLFVELKKERGYLTQHQAVWGAQLRACPGVEWFCWRPSDEDEVRRVLA